MFYSLRVKAPIEELLKAFKREASKREFGVIHSYHLSDTLRSKGFQVPGELFIQDMCKPQCAQAVLTQLSDIAAILPCRLAIYSSGEHTVISTISPQKVLEELKREGVELPPEVESTVKEVDAVVRRILKDIASSFEGAILKLTGNS